ncbi:MAG TPA: chromosome partitioning protein ParB, partial [Candidatus Cloacimonadota bacterium]|nr:chromosome partitioning protein ParB [Candidatus Cloacimonadota bacterium]
QVDEKKQLEFAELIVKNGMTVMRAEKMATQFGTIKTKSTKQTDYSTDSISQYENDLKNIYGRSTKIKAKAKDRGELIIPFKNQEELDQIIKLLLNNK